MDKYELIKDLPTFKKGEVFVLLPTGLHRYSDALMAYNSETLKKFPNILKEWFREVEGESETWKPKEGDEYYSICICGDISDGRWYKDCVDDGAMEIGNVFRTKEEAKKAVEWLKARKVLFDDAKGFKPNWKDGLPMHFAGYDYETHSLFTGVHFPKVIHPGPFFATHDDAEASIKTHKDEWLIYLGVEE